MCIIYIVPIINLCALVVLCNVGGTSDNTYPPPLPPPPLCIFWPHQVSFNWGLSPVTSFGPGPVSARWTGKLLAPATETFNVFVRAQGGVRVFLDHDLVIDAWQGMYCVL